MEQLHPLTSSTMYAAVLLDAWERGDLGSLKGHLDSTIRTQTGDDFRVDLECERRELVMGIAESMRDALLIHRAGSPVGCEMETSVQLLRHLTKLR